jgi:poly-gamma-glutamate capsule biosynthesis protein CapA/YwtB (metallophosphatase superfamily)
MMQRSFLWILLISLSGCVNSPSDIPADSPAPGLASAAISSAESTLSTPAGTVEPTASQTSSLFTDIEEPAATNTDVPESSRNVSLAFVGDIMLGRSLAKRIERGDGETIFASVESVLQSADLTVGNLECAVGEGGTREPKGYTFLAPPESASLLRNAGFDLLSLANNHSLDFGPDVFRQTGALLEENGIRFVGGGSDATRAHAPVRFEIGGVRIAFLAYADVPVEYSSEFDVRSWSAGPAAPGIAWADDEEIKRDLQALKANTDVTIVLFHFGTEGLVIPDKRQIQLSHLAIDYGADVIVGTHPHLVQGVEQYKDGWIFYSLGNFVFDGFEGQANRSVILWITVSGEKEITSSLTALNIVDGIPRIGVGYFGRG